MAEEIETPGGIPAAAIQFDFNAPRPDPPPSINERLTTRYYMRTNPAGFDSDDVGNLIDPLDDTAEPAVEPAVEPVDPLAEAAQIGGTESRDIGEDLETLGEVLPDIAQGALSGTAKGFHQINKLDPTGILPAIEAFGKRIANFLGIDTSIDEPETLPGKLTEGLAQFLPGIIPATKVARAMIGTSTIIRRVAAELLGGFAGDYATSSEKEAEGLVGLVKMIDADWAQGFGDTIQHFITKGGGEDIDEFRARLVGAAPGVLLTPVLAPAVEGLIKIASSALKSGAADDLVKVFDEVKQEADQRFREGKSPIPMGMSIEDVSPRPSQVGMREARAELKERVRAGEDFTDNPTVDPDEITEMRRELTLEAEAGQPVDLLPGEGNVTLDDPLSVPPAERDLGPPAAVEGAVEAGSFPVLRRDPRAPRAIRSIRQLMEDAQTTQTYREWYEAHRSIMEDIFGEDMQFFNDIVAITSQQASVDENIQRALRVYQAIKRGEGVEDLGLLKGVKNNLKRLIGEADPATRAQSPRLRAGKPVSADVVGGETYFAGKKIPDFVEAMRGSDEAVVMDRHMAQLLFNTSEPTMRQVLEGQRVVTIVANNLGWTPKETQAALWAFNQVRKGMDIDDVRDYQKVLTERETEIRELVAEFGVHRPGRPGGSVPAGGATGDRVVRDQRRADRFTALRRNFGIADDRRPAAGRPDGGVSRGFTRDAGGALTEELEGLTPVATYRPKAEVRRQFQLENLPAPHIVELDAASSASGFRQIIERIKASDPWGAAISVLDEADYVGARLFVTADGQAGFALRGDDIVSVFNISGSRYKGVSTSMLQLAISLGGRRLDAFDTALPRIYSQAGFSVVARLDFDAKVLRAEGIDVDAFKKTFKEFNNGEPDVVFMVLAPDEVKVYRAGDGGRVKTYEDGIKAQQQALQAGGP